MEKSWLICIVLVCLFGMKIDGFRVKRKTFYIEQVADRVGCFVTRSYNVTGTVWLIHNSTQLYIEKFNFDGGNRGVSFSFNIGMWKLNSLIIVKKCYYPASHI